jgi:hypothetical protein
LLMMELQKNPKKKEKHEWHIERKGLSWRKTKMNIERNQDQYKGKS